MHAPGEKIWVIIAAYNEAAVIGQVIGGVRRCGYPVVVVDDGSADSSAQVAERAGALVLRHPMNLGQGAALQTGIEFAIAEGAEFIITFDADGQHRPGDIAGLIAALVDNDADFALGSRFLGSSIDLPPARCAFLRAATLFTRITTGLQVTDTHNGLRAMTRRGAGHVALRQNRMAHASELLEQIARSGLRYVEVPVMIEYNAYSLGKGQRLSDSLSILVDLSAQRLHR
jgi:glycosyltransferase involved in cell wall biosynthesis